MTENAVTGIVLAGGKSRRMGKEKGLVEFKGKTLIQYAIEILQPVCENIMISTNSGLYDFLPFQKVDDEFPDSGPMGGIYSCLKSSKTEKNLVLSCDMPLMKSAFLADLLKQAPGYDIVVPWHGEERYEPMCAFYRKNAEQVFYDFIKRSNFKIPDTFASLKTLKFRVGKENGNYPHELFFNVNSKEELHFLNRIQD